MVVPQFFCNKNKFILKNDFQIALNITDDISVGYLFRVDGKTWGELHGKWLTIKKGFSWGGCRPLPSPSQTIMASLCHDFFYQYISIPNPVWDRKWADNEFKRILEINKFKYTKIYFAAARMFGEFLLDKKEDELEGVEIIRVSYGSRLPEKAAN